MDTADEMVAILDRCCDDFTFPMLDNGYVYLAATRLTLFRSSTDWAFVIEVFGFSPRAHVPDTNISTFASRLHARNPRDKYVSAAAHSNYLAAHPHDESRFVYPVEEGGWQDENCGEYVSTNGTNVQVRSEGIGVPARGDYAAADVPLQSTEQVHVYELCRYLAERHRPLILATPDELRVSVPPEMTQLLQLDAWHHPNVVDNAERPSGSEAFRQLARVLETGDVSHYRPTLSPNTHWSNWPGGGSL